MDNVASMVESEGSFYLQDRQNEAPPTSSQLATPNNQNGGAAGGQVIEGSALIIDQPEQGFGNPGGPGDPGQSTAQTLLKADVVKNSSVSVSKANEPSGAIGKGIDIAVTGPKGKNVSLDVVVSQPASNDIGVDVAMTGPNGASIDESVNVAIGNETAEGGSAFVSVDKTTSVFGTQEGSFSKSSSKGVSEYNGTTTAYSNQQTSAYDGKSDQGISLENSKNATGTQAAGFSKAMTKSVVTSAPDTMSEKEISATAAPGTQKEISVVSSQYQDGTFTENQVSV